jgi:hypothetical protein
LLTVVTLLTVSSEKLVTVYVPVAVIIALSFAPGTRIGVQLDFVVQSPLTPFVQEIVVIVALPLLCPLTKKAAAVRKW